MNTKKPRKNQKNINKLKFQLLIKVKEYIMINSISFYQVYFELQKDASLYSKISKFLTLALRKVGFDIY